MYGFSVVTHDNIILIACKKTAQLPEFPSCIQDSAACSAVLYADAATGEIKLAGIRLTPEKILQRFKGGRFFLRV